MYKENKNNENVFRYAQPTNWLLFETKCQQIDYHIGAKWLIHGTTIR